MLKRASSIAVGNLRACIGEQLNRPNRIFSHKGKVKIDIALINAVLRELESAEKVVASAERIKADNPKGIVLNLSFYAHGLFRNVASHNKLKARIPWEDKSE